MGASKYFHANLTLEFGGMGGTPKIGHLSIDDFSIVFSIPIIWPMQLLIQLPTMDLVKVDWIGAALPNELYILSQQYILHL